jgi:hypothetical protein
VGATSLLYSRTEQSAASGLFPLNPRSKGVQLNKASGPSMHSDDMPDAELMMGEA